MNKKNLQNGFTIIEMTLSMVFLSILLIAILTLTIASGKMYVKGNTTQTVNQSSRDFSDAIRRDFLATGVGTISQAIKVSGGGATLYSGRICLGTVTYLWNSADLINATTTAANAAKVKFNGQPIVFARITNPKQAYCDRDVNGRYPVVVASNEEVVDMFGGEGKDFALYAMDFTPIAVDGEAALYHVTYTLGTNQAQTTQASADGFIQCKPNNVLTADFNYCSVNDFDMIVRVGGAM